MDTAAASPGSRARWAVLALFTAVSCVSSLAWLTYAPVALGSVAFLGASPLAVSMLAAAYPALYIPGSLLGAVAARGARVDVAVGGEGANEVVAGEEEARADAPAGVVDVAKVGEGEPPRRAVGTVLPDDIDGIEGTEKALDLALQLVLF